MKISVGNSEKLYKCPKHGELDGSFVVNFQFKDKNGRKIDHSYCLYCVENFLFNEIFLLESKEES
jgi:hypothetical protein